VKLQKNRRRAEMKKYSLLHVILFSVFLIGTVLTVFIIYSDMKTSLSIKFVIGYVIYLFSYVLFTIVLAIVNAKRLNPAQLRRRLLIFIGWFISSSAVIYLTRYFSGDEMTISNLAIPLGGAFGMTFYDLMFQKKKDESIHSK
jgi:hypothetical protein